MQDARSVRSPKYRQGKRRVEPRIVLFSIPSLPNLRLIHTKKIRDLFKGTPERR
jgi:hypothetical protein